MYSLCPAGPMSEGLPRDHLAPERDDNDIKDDKYKAEEDKDEDAVDGTGEAAEGATVRGSTALGLLTVSASMALESSSGPLVTEGADVWCQGLGWADSPPFLPWDLDVEHEAQRIIIIFFFQSC